MEEVQKTISLLFCPDFQKKYDSFSTEIGQVKPKKSDTGQGASQGPGTTALPAE